MLPLLITQGTSLLINLMPFYSSRELWPCPTNRVDGIPSSTTESVKKNKNSNYWNMKKSRLFLSFIHFIFVDSFPPSTGAWSPPTQNTWRTTRLASAASATSSTGAWASDQTRTSMCPTAGWSRSNILVEIIYDEIFRSNLNPARMNLVRDCG